MTISRRNEVLVDTLVWVDFLKQEPTPQVKALRALLCDEQVLIGDLILMELMQGLRTEEQARRVWKFLEVLPCLELAGRDNALRGAQNYRRMRAAGRTVRKTIDVLIGSYCIEHGLTLLHSDRDFDAMHEVLGLSVYATA